MDLASIVVSLKVIAIIAIVLVLQVITLVQIAGLRKALRELKEVKAAPAPVPAPSTDRFERKGGDFRRHEKRPYQDQRPRSQPQSQSPAATPPAAAVDPVETSLRDINLRLKNAERDQDFARKKIQENLTGDRDQHPRGHDRSDRGNDRYRDRDGGDRNRDGGDRNRGGRDGGRDRNRNPRRDNWQDRNRQMPPQTQQAAAPVAPPVTDEPTFERKDFAAAPPLSVSTPVERTAPMTPITSPAAFSPASPLPAVDQAPVDFSGTDESLEHGRKVFVRRRPLRDEGSEGIETQVSAKEETPVGTSEGADAEIQFGRRKGR